MRKIPLDESSLSQDSGIARRFNEMLRLIHIRTDRFFARLLLVQWVVCVLLAVVVSPLSWAGRVSSVHPHIWAALLLGGAISLYPAWMGMNRAGEVLTRHLMAIAQMLTSSLLIHLTGGRIESHFHIFGSLAFLAFYRNKPVLVTATIVTAADHFLRGVFWPESIYGVFVASPWRSVEHAFWVLFEVGFLWASIRWSLSDLWEVAKRQLVLEGMNHEMEGKIEDRTRELKESESRFRNLFEESPIGLYRAAPDGTLQLVNPTLLNILGFASVEELCVAQRLWEGNPVHKERHTLLQGMAEKTASQSQDTIWPRQDGSSLVAREIVKPFRDENGRVLYLDGSVEDITERRTMETQLRHSQKMESIGQLAAGIAHEINTPTQFISDNTRFLKEAFQDVQTLLEKYDRLFQAVKENEVSPRLMTEVEEAVAAADVSYLALEVPKAIGQSLDGLERVSRIVLAMKTFSHPGSQEKKRIDLNKAIESTIIVASNEWKYIAELKTEFDPNLPLVPCFPDEINQVVLNLLVNAVHAIVDVVGENSSIKGLITVQTGVQDGFAEIRISDTGSGIPEAHRNKVFDPFFTTKQVGKGTGQGLAIAHAVIVEKHGGTISFETTSGEGTVFLIRLPLDLKSVS